MSRFARLLVPFVCAVSVAASASAQQAEETRWWKGNTHTHSWWSDGDTPPEMISAWYKERGWNFVVFSDHNIMQDGVKWYPLTKPATQQAYQDYLKGFGPDWVETRDNAGVTEVKIKTLDEFGALYSEPGKFIFVKGLEITGKFHTHPIHINGVNVATKIEPQAGDSIAGVIQNTVNAVNAYGESAGRPVFAHLNHPNFHYAVQPEDFFNIDAAPGEGFFEIYNGHPRVHNAGDALHHPTERMWDIVLAKRLGEFNKSVVYGMATDDAHEYTAWGEGKTNPGRGWVMVRAKRLTPNTITTAMKQGDFYSSSGVELEALTANPSGLSLKVRPKDGVKYRIEFVGTLKTANLKGTPKAVPHEHEGNADHVHKLTYTYSKDVGRVLKSVEGTEAHYTLTGKELYVRARVVSDRPHPNAAEPGDVEMAWTQPVVPAK